MDVSKNEISDVLSEFKTGSSNAADRKVISAALDQAIESILY